MKKNGYRMLAMVVLSTVMFLFLALISVQSVCADVSFFSAKTVSVNTAVKGKVTNGYGYERKVYRFSVAERGKIQVIFQVPEQYTTGNCWKVALYNASYTEMDSWYISGKYKKHSLTKTGVSAGTYYVTVSSSDYNRATSSDTYKLTVEYSEASNWEKEMNDSFSAATAIALNKQYYGTTRSGYGYESDYFAANVMKAGYIQPNFEHAKQANADGYWTITLYDKNYNELCSRISSGNVKKTTFPAIGVGKGKYYIKVTSRDYNNAKSTSVYKLTLKQKTSSVWEKAAL